MVILADLIEDHIERVEPRINDVNVCFETSASDTGATHVARTDRPCSSVLLCWLQGSMAEL